MGISLWFNAQNGSSEYINFRYNYPVIFTESGLTNQTVLQLVNLYFKWALNMKNSFNLVLLSTCLYGGTLFADVPVTPLFSPYADITINTHWDSQTQTLEPMDLAEVATSTGLKAFHLAFITDSGSCQPAFGSQPSYSLESQWGKRLTDKLAKNGIEINASFGGLSGNDISLNCDKNQLVAIFKETVSTYKASALDFDIENGTADVQKLIQALQIFQQQQPTIKLSLTLAVLPEGLTWEGRDIVSRAKQAGLHFHVNIMAMDYGDGFKGDMGQYAIQAATALHDYLKTLYPDKSKAELWQLIEVTPMIGVNDVNIEQFTLKNTDDLAQFAKSNQLGGLAMWSLARDKPCADKWASTACSGNNLQSYEYEYVKHFLIK